MNKTMIKLIEYNIYRSFKLVILYGGSILLLNMMLICDY